MSESVSLRKTTRGQSRMKNRDAEKRTRQRERRKAANHLNNSENGSEHIANSTMDAKVCYSLQFNRSLCIGLKLAIVVFSFQLGPISGFWAFRYLLVPCIRFVGTMFTAGYG